MLQKKHKAMIGILFAPPYTRVGSQSIVPRLGYLDERTGPHFHCFCAGYGGHHFADDAKDIGVMRYKNGVVIPWGFSQRQFAAFCSAPSKSSHQLLLLGSAIHGAPIPQ